MKRTLMVIFLCLPSLLRADDEAFRPLAGLLVIAVANRDFVKFVKCLPENTEFLEHLRSAEPGGRDITLSEVNRRLANRHRALSDGFAELMKRMEENQLGVESLSISSIAASGPRLEGKQLNLLKVGLTDRDGKRILLMVHDLVLVGNRWLVGDRVTAQTE
jgi:hypothetical protein